MTTESYIETTPTSTTFVGPDATRLYAATVLRSAIRLYLRTGLRANRAYTPTAMALAATTITNKSYARGPKGLGAAIADLTIWIEAMTAALPVVREGERS